MHGNLGGFGGFYFAQARQERVKQKEHRARSIQQRQSGHPFSRCKRFEHDLRRKLIG